LVECRVKSIQDTQADFDHRQGKNDGYDPEQQVSNDL
jgi:hypothetical protein